MSHYIVCYTVFITSFRLLEKVQRRNKTRIVACSSARPACRRSFLSLHPLRCHVSAQLSGVPSRLDQSGRRHCRPPEPPDRSWSSAIHFAAGRSRRETRNEIDRACYLCATIVNQRPSLSWQQAAGLYQRHDRCRLQACSLVGTAADFPKPVGILRVVS